MPDKIIIPIFITHLGCPFKCIFCDQNAITGHSNPSIQDVKNIIEQHEVISKKKSTTDRKTIIELAFFGGTFTGLSLNTMDEYLSVASEFPWIDYIRISTRPDTINENILKFLYSKNVRVIELGVQSLDDDVLKFVKRGYISEAVSRAAAMIKKNGFKLGLQIMAGLPEQSEKSFFNTVEKTIKLKPDMVRIYPAVVFSNTEMAQLYKNRKFNPLNVEMAANLSARAVIQFREKNIEILRVGLHTVRDENAILGGPYHPQFRYITESEIVRLKMLKILSNIPALKKTINYKTINKINKIVYNSNNDKLSDINNNVINRDRQLLTNSRTERKTIKIEINSRLLNYFYGFKKSNIKYFGMFGINFGMTVGENSGDTLDYENFHCKF